VNGIEYESHDRMVDGGECERYRPDFLFDCVTHYLVLEVDEHQHMSYPCVCEQTRMVNMVQSLGTRTIFVRYNPDSFKDHLGKTSNPGFNTRTRLLHEKLRWYMNPHVDFPAFASVLYLFYDGHNAFGVQEPIVLM
jgi:hypothetical protein